MWKKYDRVVEAICAALLGISLLINNVQVVRRYIFGSSIMWVEEISRVIQIWSVCLAITVTWSMQRHIIMESLVTRLPRKMQCYISIFNGIISTILTLVMTIYGYILMSGARISWPASGFPVKWIYLSIPIGFGVFTFREALNTIAHIKELKSIG